MRTIEAIRIGIHFNDSHASIVAQPKNPVKIGIKARIGWRILAAGLRIIVGRTKDYKQFLNPLFEEDY